MNMNKPLSILISVLLVSVSAAYGQNPQGTVAPSANAGASTAGDQTHTSKFGGNKGHSKGHGSKSRHKGNGKGKGKGNGKGNKG
jgi:hypothetical protein